MNSLHRHNLGCLMSTWMHKLKSTIEEKSPSVKITPIVILEFEEYCPKAKVKLYGAGKSLVD